MKNNRNKSKIIFYIIILLLLVGAGYYIKTKLTYGPALPAVPTEQNKKVGSDIKITSKKIGDSNFTGTEPVIEGDGVLADRARTEVEHQIADFSKQADRDVPDLRKQFGTDNPISQYEIDIDAKHLIGDKTESIVLLVYTYTGGAHGSSIYKVFTASLADGKIIELADIIQKNKQGAFVTLVKKELNAWRLPDMEGSPAFPEEVDALTFSSFANFSLDEKNLTIYFDQYAIGPGALGEVAFPIAKSKVESFFNSGF